MRNCITTFALVVVAAIPKLTAAQETSLPGVTASAVYVSESRSRNLLTGKTGLFANSLTITVRFKGKGIENVTRHGRLKISSAKEGSGKTLRFRRLFNSIQTRLQKIARFRTDITGKKAAGDELELRLRFYPPSRTATMISSLSGEVTLGIGMTTEVSVPVDKLTGLVGKTIDDPALTKLGVKVTVDRFSVKPRGSLRLKIAGAKRDAVLDAHFLDGTGKRLDFSSYVFSGFRTGTASVSCTKALPPGAVLKIRVETERKDTVVNFSLKDIPLP